ncbi:family 43 glycosylhydrolase [Aureibaculum sp. A20]|uniref:Family 43 glycosylhydrolase n=1 Tax=Aureibaculum flavum TaxID=2795986 RepID=A0ABS0WVG2_9FLAO|nr:family 43 glycosylhydrolase [Aureibaculum flavum]MBJ2175896.1 family 43 glycosylhydrolase [Aureibaculum flavum]
MKTFINITFHSIILLVFCLIGKVALAQNPITTFKGISDPHIRVFNDTIYLYSGHDAAPNDKTWVMKDWRVFATTNLLDWKHLQTITPKDNYMDDGSEDCWASDASARNGNYYFYFSDRKRGIGVMKSKHPAGNFTDVLNKPLVSPLHDPTLFTDDDKNKTPYLIYGDKTDAYYIVKLNNDMISTAETPKPIEIKGDAWKDAPEWMDKNYLFKYKELYYLSWGNQYAISKNIYGPYECVDAVGRGYKLGEFAHGSFFWWKGQFYHIWCYYIRDGYKFRESIISYCHIDDNGQIVTDTNFLDKHFSNGVGQYNASWKKIEAEWYYEKSSNIKKRGLMNKGFRLTNIKDGSWIRYAEMLFENENYEFQLQLNSVRGKGYLEIRQGNLSGQILGRISIESDNLQKKYILNNINCLKGKTDLYLTFKGTEDFNVELDYFNFLRK